jgi:hypothetical protein
MGGGGRGERLNKRDTGASYTTLKELRFSILILKSAVRVKRDDGYRIVRRIYIHQLYRTRGNYQSNLKGGDTKADCTVLGAG